MKRLLPVLGIVVIVPVVLVWILVMSAERKGKEKWQPLPNGGEIAFRGVTYGLRHEMSFSAVPFKKKLKNAAKARSWRPLFVKPDTTEFSGGNIPSLGVWFVVRGRAGILSPQKWELYLPDGQVYYSSGGGGSQINEEYLTPSIFYVIPFTAEKIKVAGVFDNKRFEWEIPNPTYDPNRRATESAEPPPQTREAGGLQITLREIKLESVTYPPTNWRAEPVFKIFSNGEDVTKRFSMSPQISDGALLSAPAWKIKTRISRTNRYPFTAEEVQWVGTFEKAQVNALEAGKYELFPDNEIAISRGLKFAGLFGPGQYDIHGGKVIRAGPVTDTNQKRAATTDWLHKENAIRVSLKEPACIVLDRWLDSVAVFRNQQNQPSAPRELWSHGSGEGSLRIYRAPDQPVRFGVADSNVPSLAGQTVEFVVRPPVIPRTEQKDLATSR